MSALPLLSASYHKPEKLESLVDALSLAESRCKRFTSNTNRNIKEMTILYDYSSKGSRVNKKSKHNLNQYRGKQSIFKEFKLPEPRRPIHRRIPDFHKNPHKWTKYSLEDVIEANEDIANKTNAQTAFSYINELRIRKKLACAASEEKKESMEVCEPVLFKSKKNSDRQIQFRKPDDPIINTEVSAITCENNKPVFRNSEVVMPEYVVGQKLTKKISKKKTVLEAVDRSKNVKLDHLQYPDEED